MVSILLTNMKDRFSFFILCMVTLSSFSSTTNTSSPLYDVMNYGAVGDGKTDDSQAFLKAWNEACNVQQQRATVNVPARTFLLNPIEFSGPCVPTSIEFQVAGKIIASTNKSLFDNNHWILFSYVKGLTLTGSGTIDGQGAGSWQDRTGVADLSWTTVINGYVRMGKLDEARQLLNQMPYRNVAAQTAMISGYVQNKRMDDARQIFNQISIRDVVCWNTMIAGYSQCGRMDEALHLFKQMVKKDIVSWNTMVASYAQVGQMDAAIKTFEEMKEKNIVSWNSLISGLTQNGSYLDALKSFMLMGHEGQKPDQSTFACGLSSCAHLAALQVGKQLHQLVMKSGYATDLFVSNALITMYAKCGSISSAELLFKDIDHFDVVSWNSLIAAYALNGNGREALKLFHKMEVEGVASRMFIMIF